MSNLANDCQQQCTDSDQAAIRLTIVTKDKDIGDFSVRRSLPNARQKMVGPWIFFDHMGPAEFAPGHGLNVRPHPHINLATVTYLFEGEILHRDALGNCLPITPGAVNLMVTGSGLVHSEREREEIRNTQHRLHGLQLWHALPSDLEEVEPSFHHYEAADIPGAEVPGGQLRVIIGSAYGCTSPVRTFCETLYVEVALIQDASIALCDAPERAIYVVSGELELDGSHIAAHTMVVLHNIPISVKATQACRFVIIGGESIGKRYIEWNFVSSRKERIEQAKADWRADNFTVIPDDQEERIPLPDEK